MLPSGRNTAISVSSASQGIDPVVAGIAGFVLLDFAVWLEHVASHKIRFSGGFIACTMPIPASTSPTGLRFHPVEILVSMGWKAGIVVLLGVPVAAVLVFEIVLNGMSMFNHSNARLPLGLDRVLRRVLVTPDMHRVHHSSIRAETDSNYGFNFPFWDRLFATYVAQPERGHPTSRSAGRVARRRAGEVRLVSCPAVPLSEKADGEVAQVEFREDAFRMQFAQRVVEAGASVASSGVRRSPGPIRDSPARDTVRRQSGSSPPNRRSPARRRRMPSPKAASRRPDFSAA